MRTIVRDINWARRARNYSLLAVGIGLVWITLDAILF